MGAAAVGIGASLIGTAVSVYGASQQADAQQKAANYQAQVARNNAVVANQNADAVMRQGEAKAVGEARAAGARVGAQRAQLGAAGVDPNVGSAVDVQSATAQAGAMAADQASYQAGLQAYGYRNQATGYGAQAGMSDMAAANANTAGWSAMAGSLLSGASQVSSKWQAWQNTTKPGGVTGDGTGPATGRLY